MHDRRVDQLIEDVICRVAELYGLVSIIDEFAFGGLESSRTRFSQLANDADFTELKERPKPLCKRTLRRHVLEYVKYTHRHARTEVRPAR